MVKFQRQMWIEGVRNTERQKEREGEKKIEKKILESFGIYLAFNRDNFYFSLNLVFVNFIEKKQLCNH